MNYTPSEAFKDLLLACDAVTNLIVKRLYPNQAPQTVLDEDPDSYCVYFAVSDVNDHHLTGPSTISRARFQVDAYARTYIAAHEIAEAIRESIDGFTGEVSGANGSMMLKHVALEDRRDGYEQGDSTESGWHRVSLDFVFWHTATLPITVA